ncbi:MAG: 3'3'-cGAMP-specific phosphodiesterase 2 [Candidatus Dichloromethanomonas elyunquensis]|nr:MAG: 3'3'-cGAMP-specific phosphodiesterase 2 [Candidatus Dichloromethanomonas elyunquensis]
MRLVNINFVDEGSVLARPVRSANGRVLLGEGVSLNYNFLTKLKQLGYDMLFIRDDRFRDVEINYAVSDKTKEIAFNAIRSVTTAVDNNPDTSINADGVRYAVLNIMEDLLCSFDILSNLTDIMGYDEYTFHHSVNTTVLALVLAMGKGYTQTRLLELGMGVLMHDIGKTRVPKEILHKSSKLNEEDFEEIKKHSGFGYDFIRKNRDFSIHSAHVAFQHHEKWMGGGYPRGLKGTDIHEFGRITAVADVYDALISKRPYREAMEPYEAYEYILAQSGYQFDPEIVKIFTKHVAVYPTGTGVILSNGLRGNVIAQNASLPNRPIVRAIFEGNNLLEQYSDFDLSKQLNIMITKIENR